MVRAAGGTAAATEEAASALLMSLALPAEGFRPGVVRAEQVLDLALLHAVPAEPGGKTGGVRSAFRPETAVAAAVAGRAEIAAAGLGHRAEAGRTLGHHDAHRAPLLAFDA